MKYFIIAGETSGDMHGAALMNAIMTLDKNAQFQYWGGDAMAAVADGLQKHIKETSIMGFAEVLMSLRKINKHFAEAKRSILAFNPDKVILIDYPGFNLRMAKWIKEQTKAKIYYYISPKVWAWKKSRINTIKKYVDEMLVILPFEKSFYKEAGIDVHYVGNPLVEKVRAFQTESRISERPIIALLPGSRNQEVARILPTMIESVAGYQSEYEVVIAGVATVDHTLYSESHRVIYDQTYELLSQARFALVTSGTATLETALFEVPQVVCYKTSALTYLIAKNLVKLKYISLVNLILDRPAVTELIQSDCNPTTIKASIDQLIQSPEVISADYTKLKEILSTDKSPSLEAAMTITQSSK